MKTFKSISLMTVVVLLAFTAQTASALNSFSNRKGDQQSIVTIKGKIVDAETMSPLVFATVAVKETNVSIVTNIDGEFTLKIGELVTAKNLEITFLDIRIKLSLSAK